MGRRKKKSTKGGETKAASMPELRRTITYPPEWVRQPPYLDMLEAIGVDAEVYIRALWHLTEYALSGIEGIRVGTSLVLGCWFHLAMFGTEPPENPFRGDPELHDTSILRNPEPLRRRMNDDCFLVADGKNPGWARAAGFKVDNVGKTSKAAGTRSRACLHLSKVVPDCIVLKVSQDSIGQIVVYFRGTSQTFISDVSANRLFHGISSVGSFARTASTSTYSGAPLGPPSISPSSGSTCMSPPARPSATSSVTSSPWVSLPGSSPLLSLPGGSPLLSLNFAPPPPARPPPRQMPKGPMAPTAGTGGLDVCFVVDCTGSMKPWMNATSQIVKQFLANLPVQEARKRVGFVAYRDFRDGPAVMRPFTEDLSQTVSFIDSLRACGGGDPPEDVAGGLAAALALNWELETRIMIFISDAPCHGRAFYSEDYLVDDDPDHFPDGDPTGLCVLELTRSLRRSHIDFTFVQITDDTDVMQSLLKEAYELAAGPENLRKFELRDLRGYLKQLDKDDLLGYDETAHGEVYAGDVEELSKTSVLRSVSSDDEMMEISDVHNDHEEPSFLYTIPSFPTLEEDAPLTDLTAMTTSSSHRIEMCKNTFLDFPLPPPRTGLRCVRSSLGRLESLGDPEESTPSTEAQPVSTALLCEALLPSIEASLKTTFLNVPTCAPGLRAVHTAAGRLDYLGTDFDD